MIRFPGLRAYVACSLTHAPGSFVREVEDFKKKLGTLCEVLCYLGTGTGASPQEVFVYDIKYCVREADLVVAICDLPSLGAGYEIATQVEFKQEPCLAVAHKMSKVSDLIIGCTSPHFEFRRYENLDEVLDMVEHILQKMADSKNKQFMMDFADADNTTKVVREVIPVGIPGLTKMPPHQYRLFEPETAAAA